MMEEDIYLFTCLFISLFILFVMKISCQEGCLDNAGGPIAMFGTQTSKSHLLNCGVIVNVFAHRTGLCCMCVQSFLGGKAVV